MRRLARRSHDGLHPSAFEAVATRRYYMFDCGTFDWRVRCVVACGTLSVARSIAFHRGLAYHERPEPVVQLAERVERLRLEPRHHIC